MIALTDKYQPVTLDAFAGLALVKKQMAMLIADPYESAWLFVGDSGTGKTSMGLAVANALRAELHHVPSRQCDLETVDKICYLCCSYTPLGAGDFHVCLVDEADQMTRAAQLAFLSKLDKDTRPPKTIFIFTANETKLLEPRFLGRCRAIKFDGRQEIESAAGFLARVWTAESKLPAPDFAALLDSNAGNLRASLNAIEMELIAPGSIQAAPVTAPARARHAAQPGARDARLPSAGSVISREFRGSKIRVQVLSDGFRFNGKKYSSLSTIAKEIAGGNRNGYSFFGLGGAA